MMLQLNYRNAATKTLFVSALTVFLCNIFLDTFFIFIVKSGSMIRVAYWELSFIVPLCLVFISLFFLKNNRSYFQYQYMNVLILAASFFSFFIGMAIPDFATGLLMVSPVIFILGIVYFFVLRAICRHFKTAHFLALAIFQISFVVIIVTLALTSMIIYMTYIIDFAYPVVVLLALLSALMSWGNLAVMQIRHRRAHGI
jgi:hypothetical protein